MKYFANVVSYIVIRQENRYVFSKHSILGNQDIKSLRTIYALIFMLAVIAIAALSGPLLTVFWD